MREYKLFILDLLNGYKNLGKIKLRKCLKNLHFTALKWNFDNAKLSLAGNVWGNKVQVTKVESCENIYVSTSNSDFKTKKNILKPQVME